jgi:cytochrome c2
MIRATAVLLLLVAGCSRPAATPLSGDASRGRADVARYGCGACHVIPGVAGANGRVGPMLVRFREQAIIAGHAPNTMTNLVHWIRDPQSVSPGTAMPNLGIDEPTARDIAAYIYTLR